MAEKAIKAKSKDNTMQAIRTAGSLNKKNSGKSIERPKILTNENNSKIELLRQSQVVNSKKKNDKYTKDLPEGVRKSMETKKKITEALNFGWGNEVGDIRKKFSIETEPLTKKRAIEIREERLEFYKTNIEKSKKAKTVSKTGVLKPAIDPIKKMRDEETSRNMKKMEKSKSSSLTAVGKNTGVKAKSAKTTTSKKASKKK